MIKTVSIIGSGNVATLLAKALLKKDINIKNICSRSMRNAAKLAELVDAKPIINVADLDSDIDLLIISVNDDSIKNVVANIELDLPVVHTSGSVGVEVLSKFSNHGIVYPFQTFSKEREINISEVPFLIEANSSMLKSKIEQFLQENISNKIHETDSVSRSKIHLAGVLSSNFTIQLLIEAKKILKSIDIPFELLEPLVKESIAKAFAIGPEKALTGPAKRGDEDTIRKQASLITSKTLRSVYQDVTILIAKGQ